MTLTDMRITAEKLCREFMGDDYISLAEITSVFGWKYNHSQVNALERTIPRESTLQVLKQKGFVLLPTPHVYCDARMIQIFDETGFGQADPDYFSGEIMLAGRWLAVHKGIFPGSENKTWEEQVSLLTPELYVPNQPEASYVLRAFNHVRGWDLLPSDYAYRTSSSSCGGDKATVALDTMTDLSFCIVDDCSREEELGLSVGYKLTER